MSTSEKVEEAAAAITEAVETTAEETSEAVAATAEAVIEQVEERAERAEEIAGDIAEGARRDRLHQENEELRKEVYECREQQQNLANTVSSLETSLAEMAGQIQAMQQPQPVIVEEASPQSTLPQSEESPEEIAAEIINPLQETANESVDALAEAAQSAPPRKKVLWI